MHSLNFAKEIMAITPYIHGEFFKKHPKVLMKGRITFPQMAIMDILRIKKGCKMSDISTVMGVTKSAVTGIVDRMIKLAIIKRVRLKNDRRVIKISLTPKGMSLSNTLYNFRLRMIDRLFAHVNEKERLQYITILKKLRDAIVAKSRTKVP